jgi:hypothetical protein
VKTNGNFPDQKAEGNKHWNAKLSYKEIIK